MQQRSTLLFLQAFPTSVAAKAASVTQVEQVLKQVGHPTVRKVAPKIHETLQQPSLSAHAITTRTKLRLALALIAQLLPLVEQIAAYEKEIERLFLTHADSQIFESLPGAGKRLAPRLLAEIGDDRSRYTACQELAALAGTALVLYQSGNYRKAHHRHACLKPLRNALYQLARTSRQQEPWADEYYQRKRAEGKSHSVALLALSNVWLRILYRMWTTHTPYDPAIFAASRQAHAPRAA
ncbi:transposase [Reticulibacter mediterranei]|uniref:transposase n=1 Tax=Reticulibacter mediterranei TaxID=2778369 RepID=UPI001F3A2A8E|nr:transposase [Reticulibacter mediterranei]